jgi:hypothetical protein
MRNQGPYPGIIGIEQKSGKAPAKENPDQHVKAQKTQ